MKPVVTLDEAALQEAVRTLWRLACAGQGRPDLVVGIATGGLICSRYLVEDVAVLPVTLGRAGTERKRRVRLAALVRHLPYAITDQLRRVEDALAAWRSGGMAAGPSPAALARLAADVERIRRHMVKAGVRRVLVLDDAVDSGATLRAVVEALRAALPDGTVLTTAVITQTRGDAVFRADMALHEGVLCRFPWSFDFHGAA